MIKKKLKIDINKSWSIISKKLLDKDKNAYLLSYQLKGGMFPTNKEKPPLDMIPLDILFDWIVKNPNDAPYILARMVPINMSLPNLHPIAVKLLMRFPNDTKLHSELSANWHKKVL
jgi:hypothetical protein